MTWQLGDDRALHRVAPQAVANGAAMLGDLPDCTEHAFSGGELPRHNAGVWVVHTASSKAPPWAQAVVWALPVVWVVSESSRRGY